MAWWDNAGAIDNCVAAYDAIGATSLADSYTDESGSGNDAALGVAPTWASGTGWIFNGSSQYLLSVVLANNYSFICRFSSYVAVGGSGAVAWGSRGDGADADMFQYPTRGTSSDWVQHGYGSSGASVAPGITEGVLALAGSKGYRNGVLDQDTAGTWAGNGAAVAIGAFNNNGAVSLYAALEAQAFAVYSDILTAGEVASLTTTMNALAAAGGAGLPVIAQHWQEFGA